MSSKHRRTLEAIFAIQTNIRWNDIVSMLVYFGAEISERAGSRVAVTLEGETIVLHRPHPGKEADRPTVKDLRDFLTDRGLTP